MIVANLLFMKSFAVFHDVPQFSADTPIVPKFQHAKTSLQINTSAEELTLIRREIAAYTQIIDRWKQGPGSFSLQDEILKAVVFYRSWLRENKIGGVLFLTSSAHHVETVAVHIACTLSNVRPIFLSPTSFSSRLIPVERADLGTPTQRVRIPGGTLEKVTDSELDTDKLAATSLKLSGIRFILQRSFGVFIAFQLARYFRGLLGKISVGLGITNSIHGISFGELLTDIAIAIDQKAYLRKKSSAARAMTKSTKLENQVVFFAHYQPEATTFPELFPMDNQLASLRLLTQALPPHLEVVFREHTPTSFYIDPTFWRPTRVGLHRSSYFFESLRELGIAFQQGSEKLIPLQSGQVRMAATIGGSIAVERALLGLRTIVLGSPWYEGMPGVLTLADIDGMSSFPRSFLLPQQSLAQESRLFLTELFNESSFSNWGIGNPTLEREISDDEIQALRSLMEKLSGKDGS